LWDACDAQMDEGVHIEPANWDMAAQPTPNYEVDQRINWSAPQSFRESR
jgi:hypothetical protein